MPINTVFIRDVGPLRWAWRTARRRFYQRILCRDHRMRLPTGRWMRLPIVDHFAREAFLTNADVDRGSEQLLISLLGGKGAFLDVGAHIGYYSLSMLPRVDSVYAFEPDPRLRALLQKNVSAIPNIEVISSAVSASEGTAHFTLERDSEVSHLSASGDSARNQIEVQVTTIDGFSARRKLAIEAIKIDVEGYDTAARSRSSPSSNPLSSPKPNPTGNCSGLPAPSIPMYSPGSATRAKEGKYCGSSFQPSPHPAKPR
jgi:FkbM family methyltransferase